MASDLTGQDSFDKVSIFMTCLPVELHTQIQLWSNFDQYHGSQIKLNVSFSFCVEGPPPGRQVPAAVPLNSTLLPVCLGDFHFPPLPKQREKENKMCLKGQSVSVCIIFGALKLIMYSHLFLDITYKCLMGFVQLSPQKSFPCLLHHGSV